MEVSNPKDPESTVGFSHGVPQATTLAGATYAQDLRVRRAMLVKAGFAVPRGATFSVGRSQVLARKFAKRVGYPVVLKPAIGDNTIEVATNLRNRRELTTAVNYLYTPPSKREKFTRAAYALTELREPGRVNGELVAPPGYRFLVEKHVYGKYLRFLVIGDEVRNVLFCPEGPWETEANRIQDLTGTTPQNLKDLAVGAARAVPGLAVAAVDIIVADLDDTAVEHAQVVELSERPWLAVQHRYAPGLGSELADEILKLGITQLPQPKVQGKVSANVLIGGAVNPVTLLQVLRDEFATLGIEGQLYESDHTLGQIRGTVEGTAADIAWVMERLLGEGIGGQRAMLVDETETNSA
jgi:hypothetical protein